jgi:hypothetical protein
VQFSVKQKVQYGQSVRLVGGTPEFGAWDPKAAPTTKWSDGDVWEVTVPLLPGKHEFKVSEILWPSRRRWAACAWAAG